MTGAEVGSAIALMLSPRQAESAMELLDEGQASKLAMLVQEITDIQSRSLDRPLASQVEVHGLNDLLGRTAKATKELERLRRSRVDPLNAEVENVNGLFRPITAALKALTDRGKRLIGAWQSQERAREAREAEEARRLLEEASLREAEAMAEAEAAETVLARGAALARAEAASKEATAVMVAAPPPTPKGYKSDEATTTVKERWAFEVVDAALVPRSFLTVDEKAIRSAVSCGVRQIPGVSITQEDSVTVRAR